MDLTALIEALRQDYVPGLVQAYEAQLRLGHQVHSEVTLKLSTGHLHTVDLLVKGATGNQLLDVRGTDRTYPDATGFVYGAMTIHFGAIAWDAMHFAPSPKITDHAAIEAWTVRWMDINAHHRVAAMAPFGGVIHDLGWSTDGGFDVDFGSAPPDAIFALFHILSDSGTQKLDISTARLPPGCLRIEAIMVRPPNQQKSHMLLQVS